MTTLPNLDRLMALSKEYNVWCRANGFPTGRSLEELNAWLRWDETAFSDDSQKLEGSDLTANEVIAWIEDFEERWNDAEGVA